MIIYNILIGSIHVPQWDEIIVWLVIYRSILQIKTDTSPDNGSQMVDTANACRLKNETTIILNK